MRRFGRRLYEEDEETQGEQETPSAFDKEMPYEEFVKKLVSGTKDEKAKKWIDYAFGGGSGDIKFTAQPAQYMSVSKLLPTQNFIGLENSIGFTVNHPDKAAGNLTSMLTEKAPNVEAGSPIWVFDGKYIIDGHHRWSQVYAFNPNAKISAVNFVASAGIEPKQVLAAVQGVIASVCGKVPVATSKIDGSSVKACNVLTDNESTMLKAAKNCLDASQMKEEFDDICEKIIEKDPERKISGIKSGFGEDESAAAKVLTYAVRNCLQLKSSNNSINGAPDREFMPQTDGGKGASKNTPDNIRKTLSKGVDDVVTKVESRIQRGSFLESFLDSANKTEDVVVAVLEDILDDKLDVWMNTPEIDDWLAEWSRKMVDYADKNGISDSEKLADSIVALRAHRDLERMMDEQGL